MPKPSYCICGKDKAEIGDTVNSTVLLCRVKHNARKSHSFSDIDGSKSSFSPMSGERKTALPLVRAED